MSFFIKPNVSINERGKKRKKLKPKPPQPKAKKDTNEEISSDEDLLENGAEIDNNYSEDENETAQEKKVRLAKEYLKEIEKEEKRRLDEIAEGDGVLSDDVISKRLKEDYLKQTGRLRTLVADKYVGVDSKSVKIFKCKDHNNSVTCLCLSSDGKFVFSGSKDAGIVKWSLEENKKVGSIRRCLENGLSVKGHKKVILSMVISWDDKFLVVSDESKDIQIWDPQELKHVNTLKGHQNAVTGVVFKKNSHILYSCSKDRSVRVWSLDDMAFVETLFGHQNAVMCIDALIRERAITAGGMDNTIRLWKIPEESQLIFSGHTGSIDTVSFINDEYFISGGDDGQISIWSIMKKKPLCSVKEAHGINPQNKLPFWVTAVASIKNSDLVASGSNSGSVKLWKLENSFRTISLCFDVPVCGFVNCIEFSLNTEKIVIAAGKECKFGRWDVVKPAKNCVIVFSLLKAQN